MIIEDAGPVIGLLIIIAFLMLCLVGMVTMVAGTLSRLVDEVRKLRKGDRS